MIEVKNIKHLFLSFVFIFISYFFYTRIFFNAPGAAGSIVNSDSLLLPQMGWELWHVPHTWDHFQWPRVPSMVPDMLWFWGSEGVGFGWRSAWDGFFLLSLVLMTAGLGSVAWRLGNLSFSQAVCVSALFLTVYVAFVSFGACFTGLRDISSLFEVFIPAYHGTSFMLSLVAATTANMAYDRKHRIAGFLPTACICVVGTFDDPMFITTFAVPFFISTRLLALRHRAEHVSISAAMKQDASVPIFLFFSCCVGFAGQLFLYRQSLGGMFKHFPLAHFPTIIHDSLYSVRASFCLVVFLLSVIPFLKFRKRIKCEEIAPYKEQLFYQGYAASVISLCIMSVSYVDLSFYRYALPATWWSIAFIISAISAGTVRKILNACMVAAPVAVVFFMFAGRHKYTNGLDRWHAPLETCINQNHDRLGLKDGVAPYWTARQVEASSNWKLQVMQVKDGDHMFIWGNNPDLYRHSVSNFNKAPEFNYFINTDGNATSDDLYRDAGTPSQVLHCPGAEVLVFRQGITLR